VELFYEFKIWAIDLTQLDRDSLHVHVSLVGYLIACILLRRKAWSVWPWFAVLLLALLGEYLDGQRLLESGVADYPNQETLWAIHGKDMINTMIAPTILLFVARFTHIFEKKQRIESLQDQEAVDSSEP